MGTFSKPSIASCFMDFLTLLLLSLAEARTLFKAGKARDGYFTNEDVIQQATRAMDILDKDFPDERHVFSYDNATTHLKRHPDALSATKMTLNSSVNFLCTAVIDGKDVKVHMRDGQFPDGTPQALYYPDGHPEAGSFKGMRQLILERNAKGAKLPDPTKLKAQCKKFDCELGRIDCCCRRILYNQPDFTNQKSILEEVCESRGYGVIFSPKYHCELSFIEQCWGYAKRIYREFPVSSNEADLERNAITALDSVPLVSMKRCVTCHLYFLCSRLTSIAGSQTDLYGLWMLIEEASTAPKQHGRVGNTEVTVCSQIQS